MKHVSSLTGQKINGEPVRLPYITVHAFCDTAEARDELEKASQDRRMSRVQAAIQPGGIATALQLYETSPTPNLIILEITNYGSELFERLEALSAICDSGTKVMIIGYSNDIALYRALLQRGISDYLVGPLDAISLIGRIADLYMDASTAKLGRTLAFIGAKGGVGSSTAAQNVASAIARDATAKVVLADLDLAFGSASLNLDLEDRQGVLEAVQDAARLDEVLLERLLTNYETNLDVLTAPASLERTYDLDIGAFDRLVDVAQASVPYVVLDIPHLWSSWAKNVLLASDEVVITAAPDLANLRNAKHLVDLLKKARPHDAPPRLVLNQVGMPKRKEIKLKDFADAVGVDVAASVPFEPATFSASSINGKMVKDLAAKSNAARAFTELAQVLSGRTERASKRKRSFADLLKPRPKR